MAEVDLDKELKGIDKELKALGDKFKNGEFEDFDKWQAETDKLNLHKGEILRAQRDMEVQRAAVTERINSTILRVAPDVVGKDAVDAQSVKFRTFLQLVYEGLRDKHVNNRQDHDNLVSSPVTLEKFVRDEIGGAFTKEFGAPAKEAKDEAKDEPKEAKKEAKAKPSEDTKEDLKTMADGAEDMSIAATEGNSKDKETWAATKDEKEALDRFFDDDGIDGENAIDPDKDFELLFRSFSRYQEAEGVPAVDRVLSEESRFANPA